MAQRQCNGKLAVLKRLRIIDTHLVLPLVLAVNITVVGVEHPAQGIGRRR